MWTEIIQIQYQYTRNSERPQKQCTAKTIQNNDSPRLNEQSCFSF